LLPTLFHQQRESVTDSAQARYDQISQSLPKSDGVRLEFFAEVVDWRELTSREDAQRLGGQHIWRDEVIAERFDWGRKKEIYAIAVRVWRLANPRELPMRESYSGCKSWIELDEGISLAGAQPVLSDTKFQEKLKEFRSALHPVAQWRAEA
jgi:hypothetical protein